ncbi:IclR family transcriptional regulator [Paenibacillus sp. J2TS4]|uniref:IclR family transcriptional regulator n=1 Tax=Paenibacillus sp. J2TS4 TaxID=2807194 RepID=UPI001B2E8B81|nr:IclR family transcriptional regulator [Paenibacillus sp. J2TS4]GIP34101.1 IclR family transcriptional regulator [Paenibacillus sp. J2TS4]
MENYLSSVKNSCRLLKLFLESPKELGVSELSRMLNLSKGAVHKLLATLESEGFIRQNPANKQYALGYTLLELGNKVLQNHDLVEIARPYLRQLADKTKELVCLCVIDGRDAIYVYRIDSQHPIRFTVDIHRRFPLYATSASRSILAFQSDDFIDSILSEEIKAFTEHSIIDPAALKQRLNKIRAEGSEMSSNMRNIGVTGVAAPIYDSAAQVVASVSLIGPTDRIIPQADFLRNCILETTAIISSGIGYNHPV